jgi:hypothetical protein
MSPIDAYLSDLRAALGDRLPPAEKNARLREVRAHLLEAAATEGEAIALSRFGAPATVARSIVRQARGYDTRSAAVLSRPAGVALAVSLFALFFGFESAGPMLALQAGYWLVFLVAALFGLRCLQTRRWLVLPVVAWSSLALAACFGISLAFPERIAPEKRHAAVAEAQRYVALLDREAQDVAAWRSGRTPDHVALGPNYLRPIYYLPGIPFGIVGRTEIMYGAQTFVNPLADADRNWAQYGEAWAKDLSVRRREAAQSLAAARAGLAHRPEQFAVQAGRCAVTSAVLAAVLLAFNALALLLGRLVNRRPQVLGHGLT